MSPTLKDAAFTLHTWARDRRWHVSKHRYSFYKSIRRAAETPTGEISGVLIPEAQAAATLREWAEGRRWADHEERDLFLRALKRVGA